MTMNRLFSFLITATLLVSLQAWSLSIKDAKTQGLVGENTQGYIEAVTKPNADTKALITEINAKRKAQYAKIAKKQGASLKQVEQLAGERNIKKTQAGHYIKAGDKWQKK